MQFQTLLQGDTLTSYVPTQGQLELALFRLRLQQMEPDIPPADQSFCPVVNPQRICNDLVDALVDADGFLPPSADLDSIILASHGLDPDLQWREFGLLGDGPDGVEECKLTASSIRHLELQLHCASLLTNAGSRELADLTDDPVWREMTAQHSADMTRRTALLAECSGLMLRGLRYWMILIASSPTATAVYKLHLRSCISSSMGPSPLEILLQRE
eukprot:2345015-Rhodomonas_salina.2